MLHERRFNQLPILPGSPTPETIIGKGGCGIIYLYQLSGENRPVAVKTLHPELLQSRRDRFSREADFLKRLQHPHIVSLEASDMQAEIPYIATTYAPNGDVRHAVPSGSRLTPSQVLPLIEQPAEALQHMHEKGISHLDVKPANLLLDHEWNVLLADFGVAMYHTEEYFVLEAGIPGTPTYMSPELAQGIGKPNAAIDQYALAVLTYELLCGVPPFTGPNALAISHGHIKKEPPPMAQFIKEMTLATSAFEEAIRKGLAKDPSERFSSIMEYAHTLHLMLVDVARLTKLAAKTFLPLPFVAQTDEENDGTTRVNIAQEPTVVVHNGIRRDVVY